MHGQVRTAEAIIASIAGRRHGVVSRAQLLEAGLSSEQIDLRISKGALITIHRGVYRVGHAARAIEATYMAAVLACGPGALLAGHSAAFLQRLLKHPPHMPEVLTPTERRIPGIRTRRSRSIDRRDATKVKGIPTTTVPRTLVDLAATLEAEELARACHEAGVLYRTTPAHVEAVLARRPNSPGAAKLCAVIRGETKVALSKLERRFLQLLREHGLPLPITNKPAGAYRVDCRWPDRHLTVELDSYRFHASRHAWEADRRREREAYARGDAFRRFVWGDVFERPELMLAELGTLLRDA
ncbi:MAG: type IV toxin-antitoxin system AbiEi family antitoxin domain-containing protein [Solirubrobacterales bacterium]